MPSLAGSGNLVRTDTGAIVAGSVPVDSSGNWSLNSSNFSNSTTPFQFNYLGSTDGGYSPSSSPVVSEEQVAPPQNTTTTLTITPNPQQTNGTQTFSGTVSPA